VDGAERTRARRAYVPRVDIYETDDALMVVADLPGIRGLPLSPPEDLDEGNRIRFQIATSHSFHNTSNRKL
jgi:hypothetical protein